MEPEPQTLDTVFLLVLFLVAFLSAVCFGLNRADRDLWNEQEKKEAERQARVKALYPELPAYEERMGVKYGSDRSDRTEDE